MRWSDIPRDPPPRLLRQFGALWLAFFAGIAVWQGVKHGLSATSVGPAVVALLGVVGLVRPGVLRPVFVGWMMLAFPVGWVVSHVALAVIFFGFFTPLALVFRLAGRDLLILKRKGTASYWQARPQAADVRRYFNQF